MALGDKIGAMFLTLGADIRDFQKKMDKAGKKMQTTGRKMSDVGKNLTMKVTAPIALIGFGMLKAAGNFEKGMNKVQALTGASEKQFKSLEDQAKELGATTQFSASQAADAMGFLAMAGFDADQILGSMGATLNLAAAANLDLGEAADIVSNIMTGYGLETSDAGRATDVLTMAMISANTDLVQLGQAMKFVGPVASTVGISFEETAAAIGLMSNAGIQGGMAGTSLRGILSKLVNQSGPAAVSMMALGEAFAVSTGETLKNADGTDASTDAFLKAGSPITNITELVDFMAKAQRGMGDDAAFAGQLMTIFGQRAGPAMAALIGQGSEALATLTTKLEESGGTAKEIADVQMMGLNGAMLSLKSAFEAVQIAVAGSGLLKFATDFANGLAGMLRSLAKANPAMLNMGVIIAGVVAAIGPLLLIIGPMVTGFGILTTAFAGLTLSALPWIAAAVLIVGAGILIMKNWDEVSKFAKTVFGPTFAAIGETFIVLRDVVVAAWQEATEDFRTILSSISDIFGAGMGDVGSKMQEASDALLFIWDTFGGLLTAIPILIWKTIANVFRGGLGVLSGYLEIFAGIFTADWGRTWDGVKKVFVSFGTTIKQVFFNAIQAIVDLMPGFVKDWLGLSDDIFGATEEMVFGLDDLMVAHDSTAEAQARGEEAARSLIAEMAKLGGTVELTEEELAALEVKAKETAEALRLLKEKGKRLKEWGDKMMETWGGLKFRLGEYTEGFAKNAKKAKEYREQQEAVNQVLEYTRDNLRTLSPEQAAFARDTEVSTEAVIQHKNAVEQTLQSLFSWSDFLTAPGGMIAGLGLLTNKLFGSDGLNKAFSKVTGLITGKLGIQDAVMGLVSKFPGLGVAIGAIGIAAKLMGVDFGKVLDGIVGGISNAIMGLKTLLTTSKRERERAASVEAFGKQVSGLGFDLSDLSMTEKAQIRALLTPFLGSGVTSINTLLSSIGLSEGDLGIDLGDRIQQQVDRHNRLGMSAIDSLATALNSGFIQDIADEFGVNLIEILDQVAAALGISGADAQARADQLTANAGAGGVVVVDPDGEVIGVDTGTPGKGAADEGESLATQRTADLEFIDALRESSNLEINTLLNSLLRGEETDALAMMAQRAVHGIQVLADTLTSANFIPELHNMAETVGTTLMEFARAAMTGTSTRDLHGLFGRVVQGDIDELNDALSGAIEERMAAIISSIGVPVSTPDGLPLSTDSPLVTTANITILLDGEVIGQVAAKNIGSLLNVQAVI